MNTETAYRVVRSRYGPLTVFSNDAGAGTKSLLTYGEWAQNEISFLQQFVEPGSAVLDIGAYIGTHTLAFARLVGTAGRVIAVEAQPDTFKVLERNILAVSATDGAPDVLGAIELKHAIASNEVGQITIPVIDVAREGSFGSASLRGAITDASHRSNSKELATGRHAPVEAITVDSLGLQSCALIKVDVEGVEDMVLRGALQTLERCSPVVYCECNTVADGLRSMAVLESAHYRIFAHVVDAFNSDNFFHVQANIFGDAREVALLGIPVEREGEIQALPVRPFELLLNVEDADDLALALLNKPQYHSEVLRLSRAATTGGDRFLNEHYAAKLELDHIQRENANLQRIRAEEWDTLERRMHTISERSLAAAKEKQAEINQLHALLTQRDTDIARLQAEIGARERDIAEMHALLMQSKHDVALIQADVRATELDSPVSDIQK